MKASEMIEKLSALDPETEILATDPGCGCCGGGGHDPGVLVRCEDGVAFVHPDELEQREAELKARMEGRRVVFRD